MVAGVDTNTNTKALTIEERLERLESQNLPPDSANRQMFIDLMVKHPKFLKIIKDLNIKDWNLKYRFGNICGEKYHEINEESCKACGFSKCRRGALNRNDFEISIKIKVPPFGIYRDENGDRIYHIDASSKMIKKTTYKNLIFSLDKYKEAPFYIRWYYSYLAIMCQQYQISPSYDVAEYIKEYKNSGLNFLYLKDANDYIPSSLDEITITTIEDESEFREWYHIIVYTYAEFLRKEEEIFAYLSKYRISL